MRLPGNTASIPALPGRLTTRTIALTCIAMVAFAANSILCRLALAQGLIDPASFTLVRIVAGAVMLCLILAFRRAGGAVHGSWPAAFALFAYAAAFSFAYISMEAAAGALLLFGTVQATMVTVGLVKGERLAMPQWLGFGLAVAGLGALLLPGTAAPRPVGALLMMCSGVAWGVYSLLGRRIGDPLAATAGNFLRAVPMAVATGAVALAFGITLEPMGIVYGILSGAVASGAGYAIWYAALRGLTPVQGASVQLSVPVMTALAGSILLGESITARLVICSAAILGGIALLISRWPKAGR